MAPVERASFGRLVREALNHVYDPPSLQRSLLRDLLSADRDPDGARAVQRALVEAVEELKPPATTPPDSPKWSQYRYARRRYLEGARLDRIADELAISERQARRHNRGALDAIAAVLWARYCQLNAQGRWSGGAEAEHAAAEGALLAELASLDRSVPGGPTLVGGALRSVLSTMADLLERRRLSFDVVRYGDTLAVSVHPVVLRQILVGLLFHAADRFPGSRARLSVLPSGDAVELLLGVDAGAPAGWAGWAPMDAPMDTASGTTLDATRQLIDLQGGVFAEHEDRQGHGELRVRLPASRPVTILVVDDNLDFLRLFERYLEDTGYRGVYADPSRDALALVADERPDVIVLDVMMPTRDGWEALQSLKSRADTRDIPVIVCSVLREPALAVALGAVAFLPKPLTRRSLLSALEEHRVHVREPAVKAPPDLGRTIR